MLKNFQLSISMPKGNFQSIYNLTIFKRLEIKSLKIQWKLKIGN